MKPIVVDAHYDLLSDVFRLRRKGETHVIERFYLDDLKKAGVNIMVCSLFVASDYIPEMALRAALNQIGYLHMEMRESPGCFVLCRNMDEAKRAVEKDQLAFFLSFEGVDPLGYDLQLLSLFYELGLRFMGLTWSRRNFAADGSHFRPQEEGTVGGLTSFGVALLKEAERLGMIVDVSHLNDPGFDDVFRFFNGLVIASHSNCRSLVGAARNLTDDQIRRIAERGGVIGLNNMIHFVYQEGKENRAVPHQGLLEHARHMIELVGDEHVGFGLDLCEFDKPEDKRDRSVFPSYRHVLPFIEAIQSEFSPQTAERILGGNWIRVLETLR